MTTLTRCREPEIMDAPNLDPARHVMALDALRRINWISRSAAQLWRDIQRVIDPPGDAPLRVLDLACGGGDVVLDLERKAAAAGVTLDIRGCDVSAVAVQRARRTAAEAGSRARFFRLDILRESLPADADVVCCTLFLHHLDEPDAIAVLRQMATATRRMVVVQDLERSGFGFLLAHLGVRLLSRSDVARVDGPRSVRAAFTPVEAASLARRAGFEPALRRFWPRRYSLTWEKT